MTILQQNLTDKSDIPTLPLLSSQEKLNSGQKGAPKISFYARKKKKTFQSMHSKNTFLIYGDSQISIN